MKILGKLKFRILRFRLITVLIAVFAVGVVCSSRPAVQLRVRQEIRQATGGDSLSAASTSRPFREVKDEIYSDAFDDVHTMWLADIKAKRHWIRAMKDWGKMSRVWLNRSGVLDADLRYLANHEHLRELYLNGNKITDQGVRNLGTSVNLQRLELNYTNVKDLAMLATSFPNLRRLKLRGTQISDAELRSLTRLVILIELDISRTQVTDSGLEILASMPHLRELRLEESRSTLGGAYWLHSQLPQCMIYATDGSTFRKEFAR